MPGAHAMANYKYLQVAEKLKGEILAAKTAAGQKIATEDELAVRFGVGRNTVRQAVDLLVGQGFLHKVQGSGTFVSEKIVEYQEKRRTAGRNKCIGVVMNQVSAYLFPNILAGISDYLFEHDYHMIIRMTLNQVAREKQVLGDLLESDVAGFIIDPARSGFPTVNRDLYHRIKQHYPCVLIHASLPEFSFPTINNSNEEACGLLVDHLVENGHRNIAAICKVDEICGHQRYRGYAMGLQRHGLKVDENRILWFVEEDFEGMFSDVNAHRIMQTIKNCTAILCFNDDFARRLLPFLEKRGMSVPEDISVVGFDNLQTGHSLKAITTIEHPKELLGRAAAEAILTLFDNPFANVTRYFPPRLIEGETVAKLAP